MDGNGNLKLADLGFAKLVFEGGRAYTVCGTPDYLAPEVIEHRGATRGSDYWALGILIFEFISGYVWLAGENTLTCILIRVPHLAGFPRSKANLNGTSSRKSARVTSSTGLRGSLKSASHTRDYFSLRKLTFRSYTAAAVI